MEFKKAFEIVDKWMKENKPQVKLFADRKNADKLDIWANEFVEYTLNENYFGIPMLECDSIEIAVSVIYVIPIISESDFLKLMEILEPN